MKVKKIAILGGGNGGITAAADLTQKGFLVNLFESEKFCKDLEFIKINNEISMEYEGNTFKQKINLITKNIQEAIEKCEIVMITVPGMGIEYFAEILAPVVKEEQVILINSSSSMGAVRFVKKAREMGIKKNFKIGETNSLTYATRVDVNKGKVKISLKAKCVYLAAYPSCNTEEVFNRCIQIYDCLKKCDNVIVVNLQNPNPLIHPGPTLLNAGRIDYAKGEFYLYKEGITRHTVNIIKAVENERKLIAKALGIHLEDIRQAGINRGYFKNEDKPLHELFNTSPMFENIKGPASVEGRYIVEDISMGLVFWSELGRILKVPTPNIDSIIILGGTLVGRDFYKEGLTLKNIGLANLDNKEKLLKNI